MTINWSKKDVIKKFQEALAGREPPPDTTASQPAPAPEKPPESPDTQTTGQG